MFLHSLPFTNPDAGTPQKGQVTEGREVGGNSNRFTIAKSPEPKVRVVSNVGVESLIIRPNLGRDSRGIPEKYLSDRRHIHKVTANVWLLALS